jgi:hypothetical protein
MVRRWDQPTTRRSVCDPWRRRLATPPSSESLLCSRSMLPSPARAYGPSVFTCENTTQHILVLVPHPAAAACTFPHTKSTVLHHFFTLSRVDTNMTWACSAVHGSNHHTRIAARPPPTEEACVVARGGQDVHSTSGTCSVGSESNSLVSLAVRESQRDVTASA